MRIGTLLDAHIPSIIPDEWQLRKLTSVLVKYCEHAFNALTTIHDVCLLLQQILHHYENSEWWHVEFAYDQFHQQVQKMLKCAQSKAELGQIRCVIPIKHQTELTLNWVKLAQSRFTISADNSTIQEIYAAIEAAEAITLNDWNVDNISQYDKVCFASADLIEDANLKEIELFWAAV